MKRFHRHLLTAIAVASLAACSSVPLDSQAPVESRTGGAVERITFNGSYNISPALSPDGRLLAFISRSGNAFRLVVLDLATPGAQPQPITDTSDDEHPSFAPNGRLLIYATRVGGRSVLMTTTLDGKIKARLPSQTADLREPVWGPFGR